MPAARRASRTTTAPPRLPCCFFAVLFIPKRAPRAGGRGQLQRRLQRERQGGARFSTKRNERSNSTQSPAARARAKKKAHDAAPSLAACSRPIARRTTALDTIYIRICWSAQAHTLPLFGFWECPPFLRRLPKNWPRRLARLLTCLSSLDVTSYSKLPRCCAKPCVAFACVAAEPLFGRAPRFCCNQSG